MKMMKTFDNGTTTAAADQEDQAPPRSCISIEVPLVSSGKASVDKMVTASSMTFSAVSPVEQQQPQVEITQRVTGLHLLHFA